MPFTEEEMEIVSNLKKVSFHNHYLRFVGCATIVSNLKKVSFHNSGSINELYAQIVSNLKKVSFHNLNEAYID